MKEKKYLNSALKISARIFTYFDLRRSRFSCHILKSGVFFLLICYGCSSQHSSSHSKKFSKNNFSKSKIRPSESMSIGASEHKFKLEDPDDLYEELQKKEEIYQSEDVKDLPKEDQSQSSYKGYFKIGNPYKIFGISYVPQDYKSFKESGIASWYGDDFHGQPTANGETYNMEEMTAAHRTLPLPSIVRVTNIKNGKTVIVKVNDRGPFTKDRIIDVSEKAAVALGFKNIGTTEVKIELLRKETDEFLKKFKIK